MMAALGQQGSKITELERKVEQLAQQNTQLESSQGIMLKANEYLGIAITQMQSIIKQQEVKISQLVESDERSLTFVQGAAPDPKSKAPVHANSSAPTVSAVPHESYRSRNPLKSTAKGHQMKRWMKEEQCAHLGVPKEVILDEMMKRGFLTPLVPRSPSNPLPPYYNAKAYCKFHQSVGHGTERCKRLGHEIQGLIDKGIEVLPDSANRVKRAREVMGYEHADIWAPV